MLSLRTALDFAQADMRDIRRQICHCLCEPTANLPLGLSPAAHFPATRQVAIVTAAAAPRASSGAGAGSSRAVRQPAASSSAVDNRRQQHLSGASAGWPPTIREMSGYAPDDNGWYNPDPEVIQEGMTFSWLWSPLIAHALGDGGHNFPRFPSAENRYSHWVERLGIVIALMDGAPFTWSDKKVADHPTHADTTFQTRVMRFMERYPDGIFIELLNEINVYGRDTAVQACHISNATL